MWFIGTALALKTSLRFGGCLVWIKPCPVGYWFHNSGTVNYLAVAIIVDDDIAWSGVLILDREPPVV